MVKIGDTEKFYVVSSDNSENGKTVLLAKYHLNNGDSETIDPNILIGIQAKKYMGVDNYYYGKSGRFVEITTEHPYGDFYWDGNVGIGSSYKYQGNIVQDNGTYVFYGNPYPYVYDENSRLYDFVENYKNLLIGMGAPSTISARFLSYEEALSIGCPSLGNNTYVDCTGFVAQENLWVVKS